LADLGRTVTRRDVVRAWCRESPAGAPGTAVEEAADRLLAHLEPESGPRGRRQGPGVAERRHEVGPPTLRRHTGSDRRPAEVERAELSRLLAERGMGLDRSGLQRRPLGLGLG
jgi:hypothetical protein